LSGDYFVGQGKEYSNLQEAIADLNQTGISGTVNFFIDSAIYNGMLEINVKPSDSLPTVNFFGESDKVIILDSNQGSSSNHLLLLNGSSNIRFNGISFKALNSSYQRLIEFDSAAYNIQFSNCNFIGLPVEVTSINRALVYSSDDFNNDHISFTGCFFLGGSYGVYANGVDVNNQEKNLEIKGNTFLNQWSGAVRLEHTNHAEVSYNHVRGDQVDDNYDGLEIRNSTSSARMINNNIHVETGGHTGIYLYNVDGKIGDTTSIVNNVISMPSNYAVRISSGKFNYLAYNTLLIRGENPSYKTLYVQSSNNNIFFNNIYSNKGGGYAFYVTQGTGVTVSNYNNFFSTGTNSIYLKNAFSGLEDFREETGHDANSLESDPIFNSDLDLKPSSPVINNAGIPLSKFQHDHDSTARDNINPDIGAYEFDLPSTDAALIDFVSPSIPICDSIGYVQVTLSNRGLNDLYTVELDWRINGSVQPSYLYNGLLGSGKDTVITLGQILFLNDSSFELKVWSKNPNNTTDVNPDNDTLSVNYLYPAMSGDYLVGWNGDFKTLEEASKALTLKGICGPVNILIEPGIYFERINLTHISGISNLNKVVFKPKSGNNNDVNLKYNSTTDSNYVIKLQNVHYVEISNLNIHALNENLGTVVSISGNSSNLLLEHNKFFGSIKKTSSSDNTIIRINDVTGDSIMLRDNEFYNGSYGLEAHALNSQDNQIEIGIINNKFFKNYRGGIYASYFNAAKIEENEVNISSTYTYYVGIKLYKLKNRVHLFANKISGSGGQYGVKLDDCDGKESEPILIVNNSIQVSGGKVKSGLKLFNSSYVHLYHNSINIIQADSMSRALDIDGDYSNQVVARNNLVANNSNGFAFYGQKQDHLVNSDYNLYYSQKDTLFYHEEGGHGWSNITSFHEATGFDENSKIIAPGFSSITDLHLCDSNVNDLGSFVQDISRDIEGNLRDTVFPDVGAYEFEPYKLTREKWFVDTNICNDTIELTTGALPEGVIYHWSTGSDLESIEVIKSGTYWVTLTNGCELVSDTINVNDRLAVDLGNDTSFCSRDTFSLYCNEYNEYNAIYNWSTGDSTSLISITKGGVYSIIVTANDCEKMDTINIGEHNQPVVDIGVDTSLCFGDSIYLGSTIETDMIYLWYPVDGTLNTPLKNETWAKTDTTSMYILYVKNDHTGCGNSDTILITINELPVVNLGQDTLVCSIYCNQQLIAGNENTQGSSYLWSTGESTSTIIPVIEGSYWVKVTDTLGCVSYDTTFVAVITGLDSSGENEIVLYPNPTMGNVNVSMKKPIGNFMLEIINQVGEVVQRNYYDEILKDIKIDISKYKSGIYHLRLMVGETQYKTVISKY